MATLFLSRYLVPVTSAPVEDGALLIHEGRIIGVGTRKELAAASSGVIVSCAIAIHLVS